MAGTSDERAEEHYLDAIEAQENDDREGALSSARQVVKLNPEHAEAWWMISTLELPLKSQPNLIQASRSLAACRKIIEIEPEHGPAWVRGGQILADELGMYEEALSWWQQRREIDALEAVPIIEQSAILADIGMYREASTHLNMVVEHDLEISPKQFTKVARLSGLLQKAADEEPSSYFRPWESRHPGWEGIRRRKNKGPMSESLIFLLFVTPFLVIEVWLSRGLAGAGFMAFCFTSMVLLATVGLGIKFTRNIFHKVNRPAFDLLRAQDIETSSGHSVIPEEIRTSKLYMSILQRRPLAYQERTLAIVEGGSALPKGWKPSIPDLEVEWDEDDDDDADDDDVKSNAGFTVLGLDEVDEEE